jgi:hypothetical protein
VVGGAAADVVVVDGIAVVAAALNQDFVVVRVVHWVWKQSRGGWCWA